MTWIKIIPFQEATGKLKRIYTKIASPTGAIDNIMKVHSLRPNTLEGHMAIYKNVLHHSNNTLPKWLLEATGVYVSLLNGCHYCYTHHYEGMKRLLKDDERSLSIWNALKANAPEQAFEARELAIMNYAFALTKEPADMQEQHLVAMREAGMNDGEILEVNQIVSYFAYANRTVLGLGVTTDGDVLGLSPGDNDDPDNWQHG